MSTRTTTNPASLMFLRVVITLQTLTVLVQGVTAGLLLSLPDRGTPHSAGAYGLFVVAVLHLAAATLVWRPGGGSPRPILYASGFLVLVLAQVALGIAHVRMVHVPLGVLMFGVSLLQLIWSWTGRRPLLATAACQPSVVCPGGCVAGPRETPKTR